jgi:hypothetical protein
MTRELISKLADTLWIISFILLVSWAVFARVKRKGLIRYIVKVYRSIRLPSLPSQKTVREVKILKPYRTIHSWNKTFLSWKIFISSVEDYNKHYKDNTKPVNIPCSLIKNTSNVTIHMDWWYHVQCKPWEEEIVYTSETKEKLKKWLIDIIEEYIPI